MIQRREGRVDPTKNESSNDDGNRREHRGRKRELFVTTEERTRDDGWRETHLILY